MSVEILSLDLDWFNRLSSRQLKDGINDFFVELNNKCVLPDIVHLVPEHQYLYPWSLKILDKYSSKMMNIVNIDEHHDFYCLDEIDFERPLATVGCWNFFAFMAHRKLISNYTWITNTKTIRDRKTNLFCDLRQAASKSVRNLKFNINVVPYVKIFDVVCNRKFDGFIIVRSPEYTCYRRRVYHAVDKALECLSIKVKRYTCRVNFSQRRVRHRANALF